MPHTPPDLRPDAPDDWLERALAADAHEHRDDYVDDAGFTANVMAALPAPAPAALPRWRKPVLTSLWASAGLGLAFALPGTVLDVTRGTFGLLAETPRSRCTRSPRSSWCSVLRRGRALQSRSSAFSRGLNPRSRAYRRRKAIISRAARAALGIHTSR